MSTKNNRAAWSWLSLFDPKTGHNVPAIEGGFEEAYQVDEEYIELNMEEPEEEEDDEYTDYTEEENTLPVFDDVDEDEE